MDPARWVMSALGLMEGYPPLAEQALGAPADHSHRLVAMTRAKGG